MILNENKILDEITQKHEIPYKEIKETDPCIIPILILLNELGYETKYSCQGHYNHEETYVMFGDSVSDKEINTLIYSIQEEVNKKHPWWTTNTWGFYRWTRAISENEFPTNYLLKIKGIIKKRIVTLLFLMDVLFILCFEERVLDESKMELKKYCEILILEMRKCLF